MTGASRVRLGVVGCGAVAQIQHLPNLNFLRDEFQIDIDGLPHTMYFKIMAEDATGRKAHLNHAIVFEVPKERCESLYAERRAEELERRRR